MNYYIVVEGKSEKPIYRFWIPIVNPILKPIDYPIQFDRNNFYIMSGEGYPHYFETIRDSILTVNDTDGIDKLVISIDSEDMSRIEKYDEIKEFIEGFSCKCPIEIIVQHFCIETWALGNRKIIKRKPTDKLLARYRSIYDVLINDPELLPELKEEGLNRCQFAYKYLRLVCSERFRNLSYTKKNPLPLLHISYFNEIKSRFLQSNQIESFSSFLVAFNSLPEINESADGK